MAEHYPPVGFHFRVEFELQGIQEQDHRFREVQGLSRELDVETIIEGGENRFVHRLPVRAKYQNLVLKRGLLTDSRLIQWFQAAIDNLEIEPIGVTVSLLNEEHKPLVGWKLVRAWPVKWSVSDLNAQDNSIAVDTIELAYQYFTPIEV